MSTSSTAVASQGTVYRVRNWQELMSRPGKGRASDPFAKFSRMGLEPGMGVRDLVRKRLLGLPNGPAAYGVWILLTHVAAETSVPGCFLDGDVPLTLEDLALITDVRLETMREALESLSRPDIRLIEVVSLEEALAPEADSQNDSDVVHVANVLKTPLKAELTPPTEAVPDPQSASLDRLTAVSIQTPDVTRFESRAEVLGTMDLCPTTEQVDLEQTERQITRLMGMFNQVEQMKRDAEAFSERAPLTHSMNPNRSKKARTRRR